MADFNFTSISTFLSDMWALAAGALRLDPNAYEAAVTQPDGVELTLAILLLAGLSRTLGQSVVLFANRVSKRYFAVSLVTTSVSFGVSVLVWAGIIWFVATTLYNSDAQFLSMLIAVALAYAPFLFGIFILLPYLGVPIGRLLRLWTLVATIVVLTLVFNLTLFAAMVCSVLGWGIVELLAFIPVLNPTNLEDWVWRLSTGKPVRQDAQEMADQLARETQKLIVQMRQQQEGNS